jgi:hypothetical protein
VSQGLGERDVLSVLPVGGGCTCRAVRFTLASTPLIVHCCHCRWCQRETGTAFALNALIEADRVRLLADAPELVPTPSNSGRGQKIARCGTCRVALWSHYAGAGDKLSFVRVGTLDEPGGAFAPGVHIYTESKQPWVVIPTGTPAFPRYYKRDEVWSGESLARYRALAAA